MTSNIGSPIIQEYFNLGKLTAKDREEMEQRVKMELRGQFRPEFLNRIDEVVIFQPLDQEQARAITRLQMNELATRLLEQGLTLEADDDAINLLCKEGFSPTQGARPLRRVIEKLLTVPLSLRILLGNIPEQARVYVGASEGKLTIDIREPVVEAEAEVEESVENEVKVDA
jgi:ATP-dependent Clp protease ATP-binding subunit ClpA